MKKKIVYMIIVTALVLTACGSVIDSETKANIPSEFERVSYDEQKLLDIIVLKHKDTGCRYIFVDGWYRGNGGVTQMFVKENGVSVPYCN